MHAFLSDSLKPHLDYTPLSPWRVLMIGLPETLHTHLTQLTQQFTWMDRPFVIDHTHSIAHAVRLSFDHAYSTVLVHQDLIHLNDDDHAIRALREDASRYQSRFILLSETPSLTPMAEWLLENAIDDHHCYTDISDNQWLLILGRGCHFFHTKRTRRLLGQGMEQTLAVFDALLEEESIEHFREAILKQVAAGLGLDTPEMMLLERHKSTDQLVCTFATQRYHPNLGRRLGSLTDPSLKSLCHKAQHDKIPVFEGNLSIFYQYYDTSDCLWVVIGAGCPKDRHQQLIEQVLRAILRFESDVHALRQLQMELHLDPLTELANERKLIQHLELTSGPRNIAQINIAQFRAVNAALGTEVADKVLITLAERLRNYFEEYCFIARVWGDSFVLVGPPEIVIKRRIDSILNVPLLINDSELPLHYYVSTHTVDLPINNPKQWLVEHEPDKALIHAHSCAKTACLRHGDSADLSRFQALTQAFYDGQLKQTFQPIIDLQNRKPFAFESGLVWEAHPKLSNDEILNLLSLGANERLIADLSDWMLRVSIQAFQEVRSHNLDLHAMVMPFSLTQLYATDMVNLIHNLIQEHQLSASELILQLPIEATLDTSNDMLELSHQLISTGADLAMGPLGSAAHLQQLSALPISFLSLDVNAFKDELTCSDGRPSMISALLTISNALCTAGIAYNIQSLTQANALAKLGCGFGQGDGLAPAMHLNQLETWFARNPSLPF
jgi:EAL domain-containing protein (putative c-di-GMP-specific phosphodiesterase class I)/GGDEF domain-containing protein